MGSVGRVRVGIGGRDEILVLEITESIVSDRPNVSRKDGWRSNALIVVDSASWLSEIVCAGAVSDACCSELVDAAAEGADAYTDDEEDFCRTVLVDEDLAGGGLPAGLGVDCDAILSGVLGRELSRLLDGVEPLLKLGGIDGTGGGVPCPWLSFLTRDIPFRENVMERTLLKDIDRFLVIPFDPADEADETSALAIEVRDDEECLCCVACGGSTCFRTPSFAGGLGPRPFANDGVATGS